MCALGARRTGRAKRIGALKKVFGILYLQSTIHSQKPWRGELRITLAPRECGREVFAASKPDMHMQRFRIVMADGQPVWPGEIMRPNHPAIGDEIVMFDYPDVHRFVVERFDRRRDWRPEDELKPLQAILRRLPAGRRVQPQGELSAHHIARRLEEGLDQALSEFPVNTMLHLSRADFVALCASEGIGDGPRQSFAVRLYSGVPIELGEDGDESSYFTGHRMLEGQPGEAGIISITCEDGAPFVLDREILWVAERLASGVITRDGAASKIFELVVPPELTKAGRRTLERIAETLGRVEHGQLSPWMAAQDLTGMKMALRGDPV